MSGKPKIILEDDTFVVVHKPTGMTVYREAGANDGDAQSWVRSRLKGDAVPVHRLDRGTCGLVVFGRSAQWAQKLQRQFLKRGVSKTYWAIVGGMMGAPEGTFRASLKSRDGEVQAALTRFRVKGFVEDEKTIPGGISWLELEPKTGRFHQIRRHLQGAGHAIVGDEQYGRTPWNEWGAQNWKVSRPLLSAVELRFLHPKTSRPVAVKTHPDADFRAVLDEFF